MKIKLPSWMLGCIILNFLSLGCGKNLQSKKTFTQEQPKPTSPSLPQKSVTYLDSLPVSENAVDFIEERMMGNFRNTYYYLKEEAPYGNAPKDSYIKDIYGNILARVNSKFKMLLDIEGSGLLISGIVVNYAKIIGNEIRYMPTIHKWGRGVGNCPLKPFRSLAVDPKRLPFGAIVQVKETIGMPLPDGTLHDGYFVTSDTGGAIKNDRIDIFTGRESWGSILSNYNIKHFQALTLTMIAVPNEKSCEQEKPL